MTTSLLQIHAYSAVFSIVLSYFILNKIYGWKSFVRQQKLFFSFILPECSDLSTDI